MGNKAPALATADTQALEKGGKHLNESKDPEVKKMAKKMQNIMMQVMMAGGPPDETKQKELFDELAQDGKISKASFGVLVRGTFNFAIKSSIAAPESMMRATLTEANDEEGGPPNMKAEALSALAIGVKAVERLDLHSLKLLERVFDYLDTDGDGSLSWDEISEFQKQLMQDPMSVCDPFRMIAGTEEKLKVDQVGEIFSDAFLFIGDALIQLVDIFEEVVTSADVIRAFESDEGLWSQFFGAAGGADGKITKQQFKDFLAQAPWEEINKGSSLAMNSPQMKNMFQFSQVYLNKFRDTVLSSLTETGTVNEGMALAYVWLKDGVDETTFMQNMLPPVRKCYEQQLKPENVKTMMADYCAMMTKNAQDVDGQLQMYKEMVSPEQFEALKPQLEAQMEQQNAMTLMIVGAVSSKIPELLEKEEVKQVLAKYAKAIDEKLPVLLHHCFRFCDINSDSKVSEKELNILFHMKDAIAEGKLDVAADYIFDVVDANGNGELSPGELLQFFAKCAHFGCSMTRVYLSLILETLLPEIVKAALPMLATQFLGKTEFTKEEFQGMLGMAQQAGPMFQAIFMEATVAIGCVCFCLGLV
jgi:Ca2+-binding EF-hand superfamily protein